MQCTSDDVFAVPIPLSHMFGVNMGIVLPVMFGATAVLVEKFEPHDLLRTVERERVSVIYGVPTVFGRVLLDLKKHPVDLSSVRTGLVGSATVARELVEDVWERLRCRVVVGYGSTEAVAVTCTTVEDDLERTASTVGRPFPGVEVRLLGDDGALSERGEGELVVRSPCMMRRYWRDPERTAERYAQGWLRTGDLMMRDAEGYYYVRSRKKDMIKSGGENVFVAEVENVLRTHPDVEDCVVFGTSDPVMGEAVAAVIQPRAGSNLTAAEVQTHCKGYIASYKKPRYVVFMDDLGRDGAGKVRKLDVVAYFDERKEQAAPRHHEKLCSDPDIYLIQVPYSGGTPIGYTNAYLIVTDERNLLVDTGVSHEASYEVLRSALQDLRVDMARTDVFATHFHIDHLGLVAALAHEDTRVYLSARDEEVFRGRGARSYRGTVKARLAREGFPPDELDELERTDASLIPRVEWPMPESFVNLADGDEVRYGGYRMRAVDTPGHTPGHQCLYLPDQKIMFYGDHVLMNSSPNMAPFPDEADSLGDYLRSLDKVAQLPVAFACMGHGFVDPRRQAEAMPARIAWLRQHHQQRLDEILARIDEVPGMTGTELAKSITWNIPHDTWEEIPIIQRWIIACETLAHLDHLRGEGRVRRERAGDAYRYFMGHYVRRTEGKER